MKSDSAVGQAMIDALRDAEKQESKFSLSDVILRAALGGDADAETVHFLKERNDEGRVVYIIRWKDWYAHFGKFADRVIKDTGTKVYFTSAGIFIASEDLPRFIKNVCLFKFGRRKLRAFIKERRETIAETDEYNALNPDKPIFVQRLPVHPFVRVNSKDRKTGAQRMTFKDDPTSRLAADPRMKNIRIIGFLVARMTGYDTEVETYGDPEEQSTATA